MGMDSHVEFQHLFQQDYRLGRAEVPYVEIEVSARRRPSPVCLQSRVRQREWFAKVCIGASWGSLLCPEHT